MDDKLKTERSKIVTDEGKMVTIFSKLMVEGVWELSIEGKNSQFTTWTEWFATSDAAIEAGMTAILNEGIDEFYSLPELKVF